MIEDIETISERRVQLFKNREAAAKTLSSLLTTIGTVEAFSQGTSINGILLIVVGVALGKEKKDVSRLTSILALCLTGPAVFTFFSQKSSSNSGVYAFIISLKSFSVFLLLRLLFMGRRLRQLGELSKYKTIS